jgi:sterol carrier protein 2
MTADSATHLLEQLASNLRANAALRKDLSSTIHGVIVFEIDGGGRWVLDLREGRGALTRQGADAGGGDGKGVDGNDGVDGSSPSPPEPDLVLTMSGDTFVKLVGKTLSSQQAFLTRKLKIKGSMGMAMKLQPVLDAAVEVPSKL